MFKSLFGKYLAAFGFIILISFLLLAVIITSMVNSYAVEAKGQSVDWALEAYSYWFSSEYGECSVDGFAGISEDERQIMMRKINTTASGILAPMVFVTDASGTVLAADTELSSLIGKRIGQSVVDQILQGESYSSIITLPDKNGSYYAGGSQFANADGEIIGMIFVCSSSAGEKALVGVMSKTIVMTSLWIMLAALIAVYFISDYLVGPLRSMITATKRFASGNLEERVQIRSKDEIGQLAEAFNQMAESLAHHERMRNTFLSNVSHDLRTPMTTIAGFIDGINSGAIPEEEHAYYLNIVSTEVHRLSRLVGQLLSLSRLESGERTFSYEHFDVCELTRLILISFEQRIEMKHLEVKFETDFDSIYAYADRDAIHQVLYNLIENAIKFSAEDKSIGINIHYTKNRRIGIEIYNEGRGIPQEDLPFIFDRFYKSDKSRGLDKTGVGLGLSIVRTIMDAHQEEIHVESDGAEWCKFIFTLKEGKKPDHPKA